MDKKIEEATKGLYLTLPLLVDKFNTEFTTRKETNEKQMAAALYRLGFKYLSRKRAYVSRKFANVNLEKLRIHCLLIESRVEYNGAKGFWVFKRGCPTFFMDEAYMLSGEFQNMSWVRPRNAVRDLVKGGYRRIVLIGGLFSWALGAVSANVHWNSSWRQKAGRPFWGKCNANMVEKYFQDFFFPVATEIPADVLDKNHTIAFCDNWSAHTKFREDFRGLSDEQMADWIFNECQEMSFFFVLFGTPFVPASCHRELSCG